MLAYLLYNMEVVETLRIRVDCAMKVKWNSLATPRLKIGLQIYFIKDQIHLRVTMYKHKHAFLSLDIEEVVAASSVFSVHIHKPHLGEAMDLARVFICQNPDLLCIYFRSGRDELPLRRDSNRALHGFCAGLGTKDPPNETPGLPSQVLLNLGNYFSDVEV